MTIELAHEPCCVDMGQPSKHTSKLLKNPKKTGVKLKLLSGSAFIFCCRVGGAGLTFLMQILLARWMGAEQLGVFVFVQAIFIILSQMMTLGYPLAIFGLSDNTWRKVNLNRYEGFYDRVYGCFWDCLYCLTV